MLNEFSRVAFRKEINRILEELQPDLDAWVQEYNEQRSHQGPLVLWQGAAAKIYR
jgi:hypothetical protein